MSRSAACRTLTALILATGVFLLIAGHIALIGAFSSYQTIFAMIARRYLDTDFAHVLRPELFMIEEGRPALELIFFPMVSLLAALLQALAAVSLDFWGRAVSVAATCVNAWVVYRLARESGDRSGALAASFFFLLSPFVWTYGRNFQNEALALLCLSAGLYAILRAKGKSTWPWLGLSALLLGLAGIMRIHFLFVLPALLLFFPRECRWGKRVFWFAAVLVLPLAWNAHDWYLQNRLPNVHSTMFMQLQVGKTFPHPLLLDWRYYAKFAENLIYWAIGPVGFLFLLAAVGGMVPERSLSRASGHPSSDAAFWIRRQLWPRVQNAASPKGCEAETGGAKGPFPPLLPWLLLTVFAWFVVLLIPQKFEAQHFYGYAAVLPMSVLAGRGFAAWMAGKKRATIVVLLIASAGIAALPAWARNIKATAYDGAVLPAADFLRANTPADALVIASHGTSGDLLYYGRRLGWTFVMLPSTDRPLSVYMLVETKGGPSRAARLERNEAYRNTVDWLEYLRGQGAGYFIVSQRAELEANPDLMKHLQQHYRRISSDTDPFYAFDLKEESRHAP